MYYKFIDITKDLSANPRKSEEQLIERIIEVYQSKKESGNDTTIWECRTFIQLLKLLNKNDQIYNQIVWNMIILILALFPPHRKSKRQWEGN